MRFGDDMPAEDDRSYFERRAEEERAKAEQAPDPVTYRLHIEFARAYERRLILEQRNKS
jgi:hypothetical protein